MFCPSPRISVGHGCAPNTTRRLFGHTRQPTGNSSYGRQTYCQISNGCHPHRPIRAPTISSFGTRSDPSTTTSGTNTDRATDGTANARLHPQTSHALLRLLPTRQAIRSPDSIPIQELTGLCSHSRIPTSQNHAPHVVSTSRDSRTHCAASSPIGQRTAITARTSTPA